MSLSLRSGGRALLAAALAHGALTGCAHAPPAPAPPEPLPALPAQEIASRPAPPAPARYEGERVTLTAANADVRMLLPLLAEQAGVNLVLGPDVRGRVSVHFQDVPARQALAAVLEQAGLTATLPLVSPWGPVVFYQLPVNIERADVPGIVRRYGVTRDVARLIVESRAPELKDR